jgi:hypothetical protein
LKQVRDTEEELQKRVVVNKKCAKKAEKIEQLKKWDRKYQAEKSEQFWAASESIPFD